MQAHAKRRRKMVKRVDAPREIVLPARYREVCPIIIRFSVIATVASACVVVFAALWSYSFYYSMATTRRAEGVTQQDEELVRKVVPGDIRSIERVRFSEDRFFLDGMSQLDLGAWCSGAAINTDLIRQCAAELNLQQLPVIQPKIYVLYPDPETHVLRQSDFKTMVEDGVATERIAAVAAVFLRRKTPMNTAEILVHLPPLKELPVVSVDGRRTVVAALAAPVDQYRSDVLTQTMPAFISAMLVALGSGHSADAEYLEYWYAPWSVAAPNVKIYAMRYASKQYVIKNKLRVQSISWSQ